MDSKYAIALELIVLGMGTVFVALFVLSYVLKFMGKFLAPTKEVTATPAQVPVEQPADDNKTAKVAAVMAAIQAVMGDTEYRVISIKPSTSASWRQSVTSYGQDNNYGGRKGN